MAISNELRNFFIFTISIIVLSVGYYIYISFNYPPIAEHETFLSELGESIGEIGLWFIAFIYTRTVLKLILGKGTLSKRILPKYSPSIDASLFQGVIHFLDRTHIYFGAGLVVIILLHVALMGIPMHILFFPAVLLLVIWQGVFGLFISWRRTSKQIKKFSYFVHAQLFSGIMIGVFSYLGHVFIDN
ncbi:hypothetical protein [uncultured Gammaproteobacteria bacterium]|nr:hypothetical protein [uncultured Gammaproteobacteria bacterium]CAC9965881.1 hypothetical protein [uncultured Gammaproteobacteria bacterium]